MSHGWLLLTISSKFLSRLSFARKFTFSCAPDDKNVFSYGAQFKKISSYIGEIFEFHLRFSSFKTVFESIFLFVDRNYMYGNKNLNTIIVFVFQFANSVKKLRGSGSANLIGRKHALPQNLQT